MRYKTGMMDMMDLHICQQTDKVNHQNKTNAKDSGIFLLKCLVRDYLSGAEIAIKIVLTIALMYDDVLCTYVIRFMIMISNKNRHIRVTPIAINSDQLSKTCGFPIKAASSRFQSSPLVCPYRRMIAEYSNSLELKLYLLLLLHDGNSSFLQTQQAFTYCADSE